MLPQERLRLDGVGGDDPRLGLADPDVRTEAAVAVELRAEHARVLHRHHRGLPDVLECLRELGELGDLGRERDLDAVDVEEVGGRLGYERADVRVRAVRADEEVGCSGEAVREDELVLAVAKRAGRG